MKIILAVIILAITFQSVQSQVVFPENNFKIEYKCEAGGNEPYVVKLYKKESVYMLERTSNGYSFKTIIDYGNDRYYDIVKSKRGTSGKRYDKINYPIITSMWHIYFKGITNELKTYQKLADKQTVMGKECDVYDSGKLSIMNSTMQYFFYGELMMKTELPGMVIEAVVLDEEPEFEDEDFAIPEDSK